MAAISRATPIMLRQSGRLGVRSNLEGEIEKIQRRFQTKGRAENPPPATSDRKPSIPKFQFNLAAQHAFGGFSPNDRLFASTRCRRATVCPHGPGVRASPLSHWGPHKPPCTMPLTAIHATQFQAGRRWGGAETSTTLPDDHRFQDEHSDLQRPPLPVRPSSGHRRGPGTASVDGHIFFQPV